MLHKYRNEYRVKDLVIYKDGKYNPYCFIAVFKKDSCIAIRCSWNELKEKLKPYKDFLIIETQQNSSYVCMKIYEDEPTAYDNPFDVDLNRYASI